MELLDQEKRGEESVTDRAERHGVRLRESSSAEVTPLLTCAYIFHSCASEKHLTSSLFSSAESGAGLSLLCASVLLGLPSSTLSQVCLLHVLEKQIRRVLMLYAFISDAGKKYGVRFFRVVLMNRFAAESVRESTQRVGACGASWRDEIMVFMRTNKS